MAKRQSTYQGLPPETIIEVVAISNFAQPNEKNYIFEIKFGDWLTMKRKPGVYYRAYEKGFTNPRDAIRIDYYKAK